MYVVCVYLYAFCFFLDHDCEHIELCICMYVCMPYCRRESAVFVLRAPFPRTFIFSSVGIQVSDKELQNR